MDVKNIQFKCQVFTPENYVKELLDSVGYKQNIVNKTILENSCGDGKILVEVVRRYINEAIKLNCSKREIKRGLESNIYGFEIDANQFQICINNLNTVVKQFGIRGVKWSLYNEDYLRNRLDIKFDFIVGNPPYITYSDLPLSERTFIKSKYETCKRGKFDYCYAFIEQSVNELTDTGKMGYLIPSSIFKTVFGSRLREFIKPHLCQIKDYTREKIFDEALVKSAIVILNKNSICENFQYIDVNSDKIFSFSKGGLTEKWIFSNDVDSGKERFGDYYKVSHVVATLFNDAYIIKAENSDELDDYYQVGTSRIEKNIVRPTATPRTMRYGKVEKIIFPYNYINGQLVRFGEEEFRKEYPGAFEYLSKFKDSLEKRSSDSRAKWFEYGRSQALAGINCEKLLISTIITDEVCVYKLSADYIPYAGMFVSFKVENNKYDLDFAKCVLESNEFISYVKKIGINISGSSLRITSKDIEEFRF